MNTELIHIKSATHNDINQLLPLLEQLFSIEKDFSFNEARQRKGLSLLLDGCGKHRAVKVAWRDDKIVGMCTAQTRISTALGEICAVLEDLVVDKAFQRQGIGTALLSAMERWATTMGISRLSLLADLENKTALDFYSQHRFSPTQLICRIKDLPV